MWVEIWYSSPFLIAAEFQLYFKHFGLNWCITAKFGWVKPSRKALLLAIYNMIDILSRQLFIAASFYYFANNNLKLRKILIRVTYFPMIISVTEINYLWELLLRCWDFFELWNDSIPMNHCWSGSLLFTMWCEVSEATFLHFPMFWAYEHYYYELSPYFLKCAFSWAT